MTGHGLTIDPERIALHGRTGGERVIGRLVERGLHDELTGEAYAIVDGVDGRTHHLRFPDIERTTDASPGAIVEASNWTDRKGRQQTSLLVRSDLSIEAQIHARGATWLDRQLVSPRPETLSGGFGSEVRDALDQRSEGLIDEGLAKRQGQRIVFARGLLDTLRDRELADAGEALDGTPRWYRSARQCRRPCRWYLPRAGDARVWPLRHDRQWHGLPARPLAAGYGPPSGAGRDRQDQPARRRRLELCPLARPSNLRR